MSAESQRSLDFDSIVLSSVDWDFIWQGQQEIAARLAQLGSSVVFVDNTAVRDPRVSDLPRILRRLARWAGAQAASRSSTPSPRGVRVLSPIVAPYPWLGISRALNRLLLVGAVQRASNGLRDPLIWAFLPTPSVVDAVRACRRQGSRVVYYCVSDFGDISGRPEAVRSSEDRLLREADLVFVNGQRLRSRFAPRHPRVRVYPFGVDFERFSPDAHRGEPAELAAIPRPRVGYVGGLHRHLALDWIVDAARELPHVSFVLVGPAQTDLTALERVPNINLIGQRPHSSLPAYLAGFDAAVVPYALTTYTESVVPTKLFEYLAMGLPVIASALPEVLAWSLPERATSIARDAREFTARVAACLSHPSIPGDIAERRAFARRYSWEALFASMLVDIEGIERDRRASA